MARSRPSSSVAARAPRDWHARFQRTFSASDCESSWCFFRPRIASPLLIMTV